MLPAYGEISLSKVIYSVQTDNMKLTRFFPFLAAVIMMPGCKHEATFPAAFFHADAMHTGIYHDAGPDSLHGIAWRFKTGGRVFSSPVTGDNTVYIGSDDGNMYALNETDGKPVWVYSTGGRISSTAALFDDKICFMSFDGFLYCLDRHSGDLVWKFKTDGEKVFSAPDIHGINANGNVIDDPYDLFLSSPAVSEEMIFIGTGKGSVYAVNAKTGEKVWQYVTGDVVHASPVCDDSSVYVGSWDSYLYAFNKHTGKVRWKFKTGTDTVYYNQVGFQSSPVLYQGTVYSGCRDAHVWAIDAATGALKWKYYNNGSWVIVTPAIRNDTLFFTTSDTHKLIAVNAITGKEYYTGNCLSYGFSSPALAGNKLFAGNSGGSLLAFDVKNGKQLWEFKTQAAVLNEDSLLTKSGELNAARLYKENSYKGALESVSKLFSLGSIVSSPAVDKGKIFFGSTNGNVYALH